MTRMRCLVLIALFSAVYFNHEVKADCGGLVEKLNGTITSPFYPSDYPPNKRCTWEIKMPPSNRIGLRFKHFKFEAADNCKFDSLTIKSKLNDGSVREHGKYCGSQAIPIIISDSNILIIEFKSDARKEYDGFVADFFNVFSECGGLIERSEGFISSPQYSLQNATEDMNCTWIIQAPLYHHIKLTFIYFKIEESNECAHDYVSIQSKMTNGGVRDYGKFCGEDYPPAIISESNSLLIQIMSNSSLQPLRFVAKFSSAECGGLIKEGKGIIRSPHFPDSYFPNKKCEWKFLVPPEHKIKLHFLNFEIEEGDGCPNDFLQIQSSSTDGSIYEYGKYCGNLKPPLITSRNNLLLNFISDGSFQKKGFQAEYSIDKWTDYEQFISTSVNQYETTEKENITFRNQTDGITNAVKLLTEKVASMEDTQKILLKNYEDLLKMSRLMKSNSVGGENSSSSIANQLFNDCGKYIFFLSRMLDSKP